MEALPRKSLIYVKWSRKKLPDVNWNLIITDLSHRKNIFMKSKAEKNDKTIEQRGDKYKWTRLHSN